MDDIIVHRDGRLTSRWKAAIVMPLPPLLGNPQISCAVRPTKVSHRSEHAAENHQTRVKSHRMLCVEAFGKAKCVKNVWTARGDCK